MIVPTRAGRWALTWLCVTSALAFITGCAVGPDFLRPQTPTVERYTYGTEPSATIPGEGQTQHFALGAKIPTEWWQLFHCSTLDAVVAEAIANNPTLQAAQASLRKSQDNLWAGYGVFFPQSDANFAATRQKFSPARFGQSTAGSIFNLFTLSTTVSYALDVFGGERRAVESLQAQVDFQHDTVRATYLTLSGNIVNAVIAQAAYSAQIQAIEELLSLERLCCINQ